MFSSIKIAMIVVTLLTAGGGFLHYKTVKADLETAKANNLILEQSVEGQKAVIEQQKRDFSSILAANQTLKEQNQILQREFAALDERFNKINGRGEGT